jgi:hypothetical protein
LQKQVRLEQEQVGDPMEWVLVIAVAVVVAAAVALFVIARVRRARLQKMVRLEIANEGNVPSCYDLRAEDPQGGLQFQFALDGENLPVHGSPGGESARARRAAQESGQPAPSRPKPRTGGIQRKAGQAMQTGGVVASLLTALGALLPRSIGAPLLQKASEIRRVQAKASYAQQVPTQMAWIKSSAQRAVPAAGSRPPVAGGQQPAPVASGDGYAWARTPIVQPGEILAAELLIRSLASSTAATDRNQQYAYRVVSRSAEQEGAPLVVQEGSIRIRGGFWARRFLPSALVVVMTIALLLLVYWLANSGALAW